MLAFGGVIEPAEIPSPKLARTTREGATGVLSACMIPTTFDENTTFPLICFFKCLKEVRYGKNLRTTNLGERPLPLLPPFIRWKSIVEKTQSWFFPTKSNFIHKIIPNFTLPPIIMEVENGPRKETSQSSSPIFHFHDYGRKGRVQWSSQYCKYYHLN